MITIKYLNWWPCIKKFDFFYFFIKKYISDEVQIIKDNKVTNDNANILFCSVFGPLNNVIQYKKLNKNCLVVFFTGECTDHPIHKDKDYKYINIADISLGFKNIQNPNYIRFPLWMTYINTNLNCGQQCMSIKDIHNKTLYDISKNKNKNKFCCILSSHDNFNTRTDIFNILNNYKKVDSGGKWKHNIDTIVPNGINNKLEWLSNYKYNICSESLISEGYVTEKIFQSLFAGCIPIYITDNNNDLIEPEIINQNIIIKYNKNNINNVLDKINYLEKNNDKYIEFLKQPILNDKACIIINNKYNEFSNLIKNKMNLVI